MKKAIIVLGIVAFFLISLMFFKNLIIKSVVTGVVSRLTGVPIHIDSFALNIFSSTIRISGFKMYNPGGFPEGILIACPKINAIYNRDALFKHKLHLLIAEIEIEEFGLAKNKEGKLNVDSLKIVQEEEEKEEKQKLKPIPMQIDLLTLSIGKIVHKDYTNGGEPSVTVQDINIHKSFKNIYSVQQLTLLLLAEPLKAAGIKSAMIFGVSMLVGVEVLPVVVAVKVFGNSSVKEFFDQSFEHVYEVSLEVMTHMGKITTEDAKNGVIKAKINGAKVTLEIKKDEEEHKTVITISARKYLFPKPDIAGGVLYQINEQLQ